MIFAILTHPLFCGKIYFAKFMGIDDYPVPHKLYGIRVNRCLPDEPSLMMHRGKPLHGG